MVFHIVAIGRIRDGALRSLCEDYLARARRYGKFEIREIPDKQRKSKSRVEIMSAESDALLGAAPEASVKIAMSRGGNQYESSSFAKRVDRWRGEARDVTFLIGGAFGLANSVLAQCDEILSLSQMTLPHELTRLVLLEQLYRGCTILSGEPYHKGI